MSGKSCAAHLLTQHGTQVELKRLLGIYTNVRGGEGTADDVEANRAGHKAWAALRSRMENQGLIETVVALVNGRQTTCIRCGLGVLLPGRKSHAQAAPINQRPGPRLSALSAISVAQLAALLINPIK